MAEYALRGAKKQSQIENQLAIYYIRYTQYEESLSGGASHPLRGLFGRFLFRREPSLAGLSAGGKA
jgi:hypothetical protein